MTGFLASGRATRFTPAGEALREQAQLARAGNSTGLVPQTEPVVARHAAALLESDAFQSVIGAMVDRARERYENSAFGATGENTRAIAHAQIQACRKIMEELQAMGDDAKIYDRIEAENSEHD